MMMKMKMIETMRTLGGVYGCSSSLVAAADSILVSSINYLGHGGLSLHLRL